MRFVIASLDSKGPRLRPFLSWAVQDLNLPGEVDQRVDQFAARAGYELPRAALVEARLAGGTPTCRKSHQP